MVCAGITVYSPLVRNGAGVTTISLLQAPISLRSIDQGIIGIGGIGHSGLQFARALGYEQVVAFSHSSRKEKDARETDVVLTVKTNSSKPGKAN
ncbi:hypothetical protein H0H93_011831 [Arthromyces matolae]|nr:hypothetical protein H0H93_011831 [Arthromyces matolae]